MADFGEWLALLVSRWQTTASGAGLGGLALIILYFLERVRGWTMPKVWYILIFVVFFILGASFLVWKDQKKQTKMLSIKLDELTKPKLKGEIVQVTNLSGSKGEIGVLFTVSIRNEGADSVVLNYHAKGYDGKRTIFLEPIMIYQSGVNIRQGNAKISLSYSKSDAIYEKTLVPLKKGDIKNGVLLFRIMDDKNFQFGDTDWSLTFEDYLKNTYETSIGASGKGSHNAPFTYVPGTGGSEIPINKSE